MEKQNLPIGSKAFFPLVRGSAFGTFVIIHSYFVNARGETVAEGRVEDRWAFGGYRAFTCRADAVLPA